VEIAVGFEAVVHYIGAQAERLLVGYGAHLSFSSRAVALTASAAFFTW
jgi:hypothetical protein